MMEPFTFLIQKLLENGRAGDGLDDLVDHAVGIGGRDGRVAESDGVGAGFVAVGLGGGVFGGAGVDAPRADAEGGEGGDGSFVGGRYLLGVSIISLMFWFNQVECS